MPEHGPFSPEMISVYVGIVTLLSFITKSVFDYVEKKEVREALLAEKKQIAEGLLAEATLRRTWEVEDRAYKLEQAKLAAAAKSAASAAARIASEASKDVVKKIEESRSERAEQLTNLTAITLESKDASTTALNVANGHNAKILEATKMAQQALEKSTKQP